VTSAARIQIVSSQWTPLTLVFLVRLPEIDVHQ